MPIRNQATSLGGLPIQIDYTSRDFEAVRAELLNLATQLTPEWTDREAGDIGVTLLEAVAYVADIISYQQDRVLNESYLATAQTREAVVNLLNLIGYQMAPASPATVSMVVQVDRAVTLPVGFTVRTASGGGEESLEYQITEEVNLPQAGFYCVNSDTDKFNRAFEGVSASDDRLIFVAGTLVTEGLGTSDGTADQLFSLSQYPICLSSNGLSNININVGPEVYQARTTFLGAEGDEAVFVYRFTSDQQVLIRFGDGINGKVPPMNQVVSASYRINGGLNGNRAGVGAINQHDNLTGVLSVYNLNQPSGGSDPETILEAKKKAPRSIRALDRCVTLDDFEAMALLTTGGSIRAARAVQGNSPIDVTVYVASQGTNPVPSGEWFPSLQSGYGDIGAVGRWLNQKKPAPTRLTIEPPTVVNPYFEADIYVYPNLLRQTVEFDVDLSIQNLLTRVTDDFGQNVPLSAVIQAIENTRGVDYVTVKAFHRSPQVTYLRGDKSNFDSGTHAVTELTENVQRDSYEIHWLSSSQFHLKSKAKGLFRNLNGSLREWSTVGQNNIVYYNPTPSDTELDTVELFKLEASNPNFTNGDVWEFSVDDYLGNIVTGEHEIIVTPLSAEGRLEPTQFVLKYLGGI